jgi:LysR family transcriptional regulator for metE and metH
MVEIGYEIERRMLEAERDFERIANGEAGQLRIAVECHSCFDWLMPSMDSFREHRPEVELDLVSGFHADPVGLLDEGRAELVIVSRATPRPGIVYRPLFRYEVLALVARRHPLARKAFLTARDFAGETLVTYPIPDERIDVIRDVLKPAKVEPQRRATELTVAILQLVASHRGVAALPGWTVQPFLDRDYVAGLPIGKKGLFSNLYAATTRPLARAAYLAEFVRLMKEISFASLQRVGPLE